MLGRYLDLGRPVSDHPDNDGLALWLPGFRPQAGATTWHDASRRTGAVTLVGSPPWAPAAGGLGVSLDGSTQYAGGSAAVTPFSFADKSFVMWIKPTAVSSLRGLIDKDTDPTGGWGFWLAGSGKLVWWPSGGADVTDSGSAAVAAGAWTRVGVSWNRLTRGTRFYYDGRPSTAGTVTASDADATEGGVSPLQVGNLRNNLSGGAFAFPGVIAEVRGLVGVKDDGWFARDYEWSRSPAADPRLRRWSRKTWLMSPVEGGGGGGNRRRRVLIGGAG